MKNGDYDKRNRPLKPKRKAARSRFYRQRETLWKGFDLKSATPIRKTDLDGFYAR
jgi:hypothetical protein